MGIRHFHDADFKCLKLFVWTHIVILIEIIGRVNEDARVYFCLGSGEKRGISERRVQKLCEENRIPGIAKFSRLWLIPKDAEKPADGRRKEYKKLRNN